MSLVKERLKLIQSGNTRYKFTGQYCGYERVTRKKTQYSLLFRNVYFYHHKDVLFRQHVHILVDNKSVLHTLEEGCNYEFTAEIYNYTRKPRDGAYHRTFQYGLTKISKAKKIT